MTNLSVADINGYLAATGWVRQPEDWRGAAVWVHEDDHEILVPGTDELSDGARRIREILALLARLEGRSREEIASDIGAPMADVQWYRAPIVPLEGHFGLVDAVTALTSAEAALSAAARAVVTGPRPAFDGGTPKAVRDLLARAWIGPIVPSQNILAIRVPLDHDHSGDQPLARRSLVLLQRATVLLHEASAEAHRTGDISVFDGIVRDGVSADLCVALARFAGPDPGTRFEVGFRWARAMPSELPASKVVFEAETGILLRRVAHRLRRLPRQNASVTGLIGTLFDNGGEDRFRVHVRGEVFVGDGEPRKAIWVRLPGETAYDLAVEAHRNRTPVRAHGTLMEVHRRLELMATSFDRVPVDRTEES
ncbi:hypothetical protein DQ384_17865 [Sphaerisporangium album]|uniref:Uncharacterized protein n=1 Tax=Sphaerisporangium album TaxID=509200 RepID=A0A367FID2_9ACTN|nr:hypothetical protein DQ384_17865 [Sphaerisporangium album]